VECRVKHREMGNRGEHPASFLDAEHVDGVMQRGQRAEDFEMIGESAAATRELTGMIIRHRTPAGGLGWVASQSPSGWWNFMRSRCMPLEMMPRMAARSGASSGHQRPQSTGGWRGEE